MGFIKEPDGVDFTVINRKLTDEERAEISIHIAKRKLEIAKIRKRREAAARYREKKKAAAKV